MRTLAFSLGLLSSALVLPGAGSAQDFRQTVTRQREAAASATIRRCSGTA